MKFKALSALAISAALLAGCGATEEEKTTGEATEKTAETEKAAEVVTTASLVNDAAAVVNALSENGTWIVAILGDVTVDQEIVAAGEFRDKGAADGDIYRKLALYAQDEDHNITDVYTLTVPKLTIQSENFKIQGGILKGDVLVEANGFVLDETATVEGNLYFANEDVKATATITGKVTGANEVAGGADVVTTASLVNDADAFVNAVSEEGTWIIATLGDVTVDQDVVVAGEFRDKDQADGDIYRKIGLYAQDEDRNITDVYTLTVPKLTVQSENLKIHGGIVKGNVVVEAKGFILDETATIEGNLYFANEDVKSASEVNGKVTGATEVK